ncbi:MAG: PepSY-like domain-containing protein [Tannerella sp.]|jgi:hypothetical protein|nr:PepSY-like domain-containing protein [Tannerella sp.]
MSTKKIVAIIVCLLTIHLSAVASDDKPITFNQLPAESQQLIKKHFPEQSVALVKMESDFFDKSYEVIFTNGNKIEFDRKGLWTEIDCKYSQFPEDLIPMQIRVYVSKNFPNIKVYKIEKEDRNCHEVGLANGVDLKFDSKYNLIDMDH